MAPPVFAVVEGATSLGSQPVRFSAHRPPSPLGGRSLGGQEPLRLDPVTSPDSTRNRLRERRILRSFALPSREDIMKRLAHTLGKFRQTFQRSFGRPQAQKRSTYRPFFDHMERRDLPAASLLAPAQVAGSVSVELDPLADVTAGVQQVVTFGVPFTRGSVTTAQLSQLRVLKNGVEIPAFVQELADWHSIDDPAIDGQSVRVARIQIPYTFSSLNPESITVQWGGPARALNVSTMQDPRLEWHLVTSGSFVAADGVQEPNVLPVLPAAYMAQGMLDAPTTPDNSSVAEARDNPATMDAATFTGYNEYDSAEKNFFYTIVNQNGTTTSTPIDYKTDPEPWLYDRSSGMYALYMRSGFATALREAVRSTDFYVNHLDANGSFTLKPGDPKYSYNESLAYTYWLLGDDKMLAPISAVTHAFDGTQTHWTPDLSFWTERNSGDKLMANEIAYEVTGSATFKAGVQTIVADFVYLQNGANGQLPANRIDGGLYHYGFQHDLDEVSSANVVIASSWMSALVADPMVRVFEVWQDNAQIPDFMVRLGNFEKAASKTDADGQFGGVTRYPDYLMRADGTSDNRSDTDVQHAMDVGMVAAWSSYFAELRGTPDASLRQLANDLYATYDRGVNFWTSTSDGFEVTPPRRYNWEYKNSASFSWALTASDAPNQAGTLSFSAAAFSVVENQGMATITVTRRGGSTGSVTVDYATTGGTATAGSDYTAVHGTLTFAAGETTKTFTVPITNDSAVENVETVQLTLSNPTGGAALDTPATATLSIDSDDTTSQPITVTLQQGVSGYASTGDAAISTQNAQFTGGNGSTDVGDSQLGVYQLSGTGGYSTEGLLRFSNLGITSDSVTRATVTSASLTLTLDSFSTGANIRGYYLLDPWTTAAGTDLGWLHTGTGKDWTTPGAVGQGTDVVAGKSFLISGITGNGTQTITVNLDPAVVQSWIDNPSLDQGIVLVNETTGAVVRIDSAENGTVANRPKLSVQYTVSAASTPQASSLAFSNATYSVGEGQGTATITVTRTGNTAGSVSVNYATSNVTATAGSDYTATSGTLTFADGETTKTFTVPILDDTLVEGDERLNLTLSNPTGGATLGSQSAASLTITDNDAAQAGTLQFSTAAYTVSESQGTATITVTRTGGSDVAVTVAYATSNGTAAAGSDYTASSGTLSFAVGETSKTFTVPILDDTLVEGNETVNLTLTSPTGGATLGGQSTATLTIVDNDTAQPGSLQFSAAAFTVNEPQGTATITVTRTGGSNVPVTVAYATSNGTATAGSDYTASSGTLTFAVGETTKTFTVPILDDTLVEGNETVKLTLTSPTGGATLGGQSTATLTIVSDDTAGTGTPTTITYQQGVGGYTGTTDVSISTQYAQYNAGNGTTDLSDTQLGDYQLTGSGAYSVEDLIRFSNLGIAPGAVVSGATLTLSLDQFSDNATIRGYYLLAPWNGASGTSLGWVKRGTGQNWASPGALGQGTDVVAGKSFVVTVAGGKTSPIALDPAVVQSWIDNPAANQGILLVNETTGAVVRINASESSKAANRPKLSITYNTGAVTPQPGALQFSTPTYTVNENGGTATITVTRTGGSDGSVTVHYATSDGTATAGSDYTAASGTLTFAAGETTKTFTVPIIADQIAEGDETIKLTLTSPTGGATLGGQNTAVLTIHDTPVLQSIAVTPVNPSITTGQSTQFTVTGHFSDGSTQTLTSGVSWSSSSTSIVTISQSGLAAAVGVGSSMITATDAGFTGSTTLTVTAVTGNPTVGVHTLAFVPFNSPAGTLSTNPITTQTADSTVLAWVGRGQIGTFTSATAPTDNKGNTAVQLDKTHSFAPNFPNSGMALYDFPSFMGGANDIFNALMPSKDEVTISIVEIKNGGVIQDEQFAQVASGTTQTSLNVTTTGPATLVSFWSGDAATGPISAVPGNGFTLLDSQSNGNNAVQMAVASKDVSAAGTYNVTWTTSPQQTGYIWIVAVQHGTPAPKPGTLQLSASSSTVNENQGTATVTVNRTGGSDGAVTVHYATSNGTATAGSDYTATSGTLTFAAGETQKTFTVPITDDTAVEGNETFNVTLSSPTGGAALGSPTSSTITIVDNDTAPAVGKFTDVTDSSGINAIIAQKYQEDPNWWLSGEHLVDLDNDGDLDLFLDAHNGTSVVALNDGHGHFTRVTDGSWPSTEIHEMVDINGDGKVDLNATFDDGGSQWWINNSTPGHVNFTPTTITRDGNSSREQVLFDFNGDGNVDWFRSAEPGLVVDFGDGHGNFTQGSKSFTIPGTDSNNNASFLPGDFDGDGKTDLLILVGGNYDGTPGKTLVWHNNGNGTFTDVTATSGLPANGTIVKGVGDYNEDGSLDLIAVADKSMPPVIYLNDGHGHFVVKPNAISGVAPESLDYTSWGTAVVTDFDNDGIPDIIMDGKYYLKVLRGTGGGNFTYMNDAWGIKDTAASAVDDGLTFGDIDGDGRIDIIGYDETFPSRTINVYHNDLTPQNWLNVRLVGAAGNVNAAGAQIQIFAAGTTQLLWDEQVADYDFQVATSYYGYDQTERHFGLGSRTNVDIVVQFASGKVTRLNNVSADQTVQMLEG